MANRVKNINKELITWAITRSGKDPEDFYLLNPEVESWIEGEKYPTVKQLEKFTRKVHVPFGYMFLPKPPKEEIPFPFFRTGKKETTEQVSLNVYHTIQSIQERQNWLTEYLKELDFTDLDFVGKYDTHADYKEIVADIRKVLQLNEDWARQCKNWQTALNVLSDRIEEAGIIVTFNSVVGNNTHRKIEVKECRGFVLVNKKAPFLFVNAADAKAAQMFTLLHELAHIWLGESAGFDNQKMLPANHPVEIMCDKVAAEFLVPEKLILNQWGAERNFKKLSRIFKVSPIVIARRALDLHLINEGEFFSFYNSYMKDFKDKKESEPNGGDFYATAKKRLSLRFASFVNHAVREERLLYRDAFRLTNLKGGTYDSFVKEYLST